MQFSSQGAGMRWGELVARPLHEHAMVGKVQLMHFDETHELLWTCTGGGRVLCHACPSLQMASCTSAFPADAALDAAVLPQGRLLAITRTQAKLLNWGGTLAAEHHDAAAHLASCAPLPNAPTSAIIASSDGVVRTWDFEHACYTGERTLHVPLTHVRSNSHRGSLAVATDDGKVGMVDLRQSVSLFATASAHPGGVNEISIAGDSLATCGFRAGNGYAAASYDSVVCVFDVRNAVRPVTQIVFAAGAMCVALHPRLHGTLMLASTMPVFSMADIGSGSVQQMHDVHTEGAALSAGAMSSSGSCLAFASDAGYLHLWSTHQMPMVNTHSVPIDLPARRPQVAPLAESESFAVLAFYKEYCKCEEPLASEADPSTIVEVGMPPRVLDPSLARAAKKSGDGVMHVRNPNARSDMAPGQNAAAVALLRNQRVQPQDSVVDEQDVAVQRKAERREARGLTGGCLLPSALVYRTIPVRRKQKAFVDLDFAAQMTSTIFSGLENLAPNSYCNALLQALYFQPDFRDNVLRHKANPDNEASLLDELRFLFQMLLESRGIPCQASNLLRVLRNLPEAATVGLLEAQGERSLNTSLESQAETTRERSAPRRIVKLTRFCLDLLHRELANQGTAGGGFISPRGGKDAGHARGGAAAQRAPRRATPEAVAAGPWVETLFGMRMLQHMKCARREENRMRTARSMLLDLQYPAPGSTTARPSFADVVQRSLADEKTLKMWFDETLGYQIVQSKRCPENLPPALLINTELYKVGNLAFWQDVPSPEGGTRPWLPWAISIATKPSQLQVLVRQSDSAADLQRAQAADAHLAEAGWTQQTYVLTTVVSHIRDEDDLDSDQANKDDLEGSLVAQVRVLPSHLGKSPTIAKPSLGLKPLALPVLAPLGDNAAHLPPSLTPVKPPVAGPVGGTFSPATATALQLPDDLFATPPGSAGPPPPYPNQNVLDASVTLAQRVAGLHIPDADPKKQLLQHPGRWVTFNDFTVEECPEAQVRNLYADQKVPCILVYSQVGAVEGDERRTQAEVREVIDEQQFAALCRSKSLQAPAKRPREVPFTPLDLSRGPPGPELLLALDAEFVALTPAQKKLVEGREIEVKPMGMCLARVSAIVGSGPQAGTPCIDDRICMVDSVYDYLTKFSGLQAGDLHPSSSRYYLTTLKKAYMKLRYLVDRGCIFVGHGLRQDFRMINLTVPPEQVIDTVELFRLHQKRMLSLRYLCAYLLRRTIQTGNHDSIEDAYAALDLYHKYRELKEAGQLQGVIQELYAWGAQNAWTATVVWRDNQPFPADQAP